MAFAADHDILFERLGDELRNAPQPASDLFAKVIASACTRIPILSRAGKATRVGELIDAQAWTEAALALVEIELPAWRLRRLVYEDGQWLCSLSRQPNLPIEFDDSADGVHEVLPLAILRAFIEARCVGAAAEKVETSVPQLAPGHELVMCCENFA